MADTFSFTSTGKRVKNQKGGKTASIGRFDPSTGKVYQKPVPGEDVKGGSVQVTNPAASTLSRNQRTASLGMGAAGQRGRSRDV